MRKYIFPKNVASAPLQFPKAIYDDSPNEQYEGRIFTIADYVWINSDEVNVYFFETQAIYKLNKEAKSFTDAFNILKKGFAESKRVEVIYDENFSIIEVAVPSREIFNYPLFQSRDFLDEVNLALTEVIESEAKLVEIFQYIVKQSCKGGTPDIDICIPFHFKWDGCYARAHKMRFIIEQSYGYKTEKLFTYDSKVPRTHDNVYTLAVKSEDVCIEWWYHVAPVVRFKKGKKILKRVIDPSMSNVPLKVTEWIKLQESTLCNPHARVGATEYRPSYVYFPNGYTDPDYVHTNATLLEYGSRDRLIANIIANNTDTNVA